MARTHRRDDNDEMQYACPGCGKYTSPETGWIAWPDPGADFPEPYCGEPCQRMHYMKNGWTDADFPA